jgi:primosomal protein N' (replication factor Y)
MTLRFPNLRVSRLDRDVVERKGEAARVVDAFGDGEIDVLVGTALVAKGLDVPQVTLVGVVSADIALNLPDERAAERTYQLLAQAIGRAGRGYRPGTAIIQTYQPDHPVISAVKNDDGDSFYAAELASRRLFKSPPFGEVIKLTVAVEDREAAERKASEMASALRNHVSEMNLDCEVLGPVPAYVARRAGKWRFHVVLRGERPLGVLGGDPGSPWSVDVDPESLL